MSYYAMVVVIEATDADQARAILDRDEDVMDLDSMDDHIMFVGSAWTVEPFNGDWRYPMFDTVSVVGQRRPSSLET